MSSIANLGSASAALPPINVHPHGHKKGSHVESTSDSSSDTAAQVPAGTAQNLFGSLLQSLEQVIGVQSATAAPSTGVSSTSSTSTAPGAATATVGSTAAASVAGSRGTGAAQTPNALLKNYLNNLSQNLQADGAQLAKFAGSSVNATA